MTRLIPTCMGNTAQEAVVMSTDPVNPHVHGEHGDPDNPDRLMIG